MEIPKTWILRCLSAVPRFKHNIKLYSSFFDVVLIINYEFIRLSHEFWLPQFSILDIKSVMKQNAKVYLSACGDDYAYLNHSSKFRYTSYTNPKKSNYFTKRYLIVFRIVRELVEGVIPVMYDYAIAYRCLNESDSIKVFPTIPLPVDNKKISPLNVVRDKIVIFHGLNRSSKGTNLIVEALNAIQLKYNERVEVIIDGKMPLTKYLKLLSRTNIVIDQCFVYSYGMNALYSMAMGKVVLSGNEPECGIEFGVNNIPVINILPNVQDIQSKIEEFINNPNLINEFSRSSVSFVDNFHNNIKVAKQYIQLFEMNTLS